MPHPKIRDGQGMYVRLSSLTRGQARKPDVHSFTESEVFAQCQRTRLKSHPVRGRFRPTMAHRNCKVRAKNWGRGQPCQSHGRKKSATIHPHHCHLVENAYVPEPLPSWDQSIRPRRRACKPILGLAAINSITPDLVPPIAHVLSRNCGNRPPLRAHFGKCKTANKAARRPGAAMVVLPLANGAALLWTIGGTARCLGLSFASAIHGNPARLITRAMDIGNGLIALRLTQIWRAAQPAARDKKLGCCVAQRRAGNIISPNSPRLKRHWGCFWRQSAVPVAKHCQPSLNGIASRRGSLPSTGVPCGRGRGELNQSQDLVGVRKSGM